jgi:hypothetical protein
VEPPEQECPQIRPTIVAVTSSIRTDGTSPFAETVRGAMVTTTSDSRPARTSFRTSEGVAEAWRSVGSEDIRREANRSGRMN